MNASNNQIMNKEMESGKQQIVQDYKNHLKKAKGGNQREGSLLTQSEDSSIANRKSLV